MEKCHSICLEMFKQRGYKIIEYDDKQIIAQKNLETKSDDSSNEDSDDEQKDLVCAFLSDTNKFNKERLKEILGLMQKIEVKHGIIICLSDCTTAAKTIINDIKDVRIELFKMDELQFNITKHRLQPKFSKIDDEYATILKNKFGNKLHFLLKKDPICRFYGYERGNIIRVIRRNGYILYRMVK